MNNESAILFEYTKALNPESLYKSRNDSLDRHLFIRDQIYGEIKVVWIVHKIQTGDLA